MEHSSAQGHVSAAFMTERRQLCFDWMVVNLYHLGEQVYDKLQAMHHTGVLMLACVLATQQEASPSGPSVHV